MKAAEQQGILRKLIRFFNEVKAEGRKVAWPTRRETLMTTVFVFVFALMAAIYFLLVDQVVFHFVNWVINLVQ